MQKRRNALPKPILKWAGGKNQLLDKLKARVPRKYGQYIEPFVGGGAMFFAIRPRSGVIADSNPELVNVYRCLADKVEAVITHLKTFENSEEKFYKIRALKFSDLDKEYAAARTIYLNRTCFNGLYRVNRQGDFNVAFGRYKNPKICDQEALLSASDVLQNVKIMHGDYKDVLQETAKCGDFVFLDPPYLPISKHSFRGYTKEQFCREDHQELSNEVKRLQQIGCHVVLTNSNHPLVRELYEQHEIEVVSTRRNISSKAETRTGEDVIVRIRPSNPPTRHMSKRKIADVA